MGLDGGLWLVVGLGNPGPRYQGNRHNVGFMVVDLVSKHGANFAWTRSDRFSCDLAEGLLAGAPTLLVKPRTFMNLSGTSLAPLSRFHRASPERMVVVHDDVDLEPGRLKVKAGGGDGGHNGLRSLSESLGTGDYLRVRFGVGRPASGEVADHVLSDFDAAELEGVQRGIARAADAVTAILRNGPRDAMNRFNARPRPAEDAEPVTAGAAASPRPCRRGHESKEDHNGNCTDQQKADNKEGT